MPPPSHPPPGALHAPHTLRNRGPILGVLAPLLADARAVLEIGCGTGEQAAHFARALPHLRWLPSDLDPAALASAAAWRAAGGAPNLMAPVRLDAARPPWALPAGFAPDAVVCINMIHIAPPAACEGLLAGAGALLPAAGALYLYGPFRVGGAHSSEGNAAFDADLRARNPDLGLRDVEAVIARAADHGLTHEATVRMPANNLSVTFRRAGR